jgi:hypothetical protein
MSPSNAGSSSRAVPPSVLILSADGGLADALVRELAGRRYQPILGRPGWTWTALLEWACPVAAVVGTDHPAARSDRFLAASEDLEVGLVVFGQPADGAPRFEARRAPAATVSSADARLIGGAVDAAVRRRSA